MGLFTQVDRYYTDARKVVIRGHVSYVILIPGMSSSEVTLVTSLQPQGRGLNCWRNKELHIINIKDNTRRCGLDKQIGLMLQCEDWWATFTLTPSTKISKFGHGARQVNQNRKSAIAFAKQRSFYYFCLYLCFVLAWQTYFLVLFRKKKLTKVAFAETNLNDVGFSFFPCFASNGFLNHLTALQASVLYLFSLLLVLSRCCWWPSCCCGSLTMR